MLEALRREPLKTVAELGGCDALAAAPAAQQGAKRWVQGRGQVCRAAVPACARGWYA